MGKKNLSLKKMLGEESNVFDRKFGLKSIVEGYSGKNKSFSIDELAEQKKQKMKKLVEMYNGIYYICIDDIKKANKLDNDFLVFQIPDFYNDIRVDRDECYYYLSEKLKHKKFNVCSVDETHIFISWKDALKN